MTDANERIATANSLKQNVLRSQGLYDRLSALLQNVGILAGTLTRRPLLSKTPRHRNASYTEAKSMLIQSIILGLGLGLAIIALITMRDDRFNSLVEVAEKFGDNVVGQVPGNQSFVKSRWLF